ncbi:hypothetical protein GCM10023310_06810 [Paenibacillus vulneris]
MLLFRTRDTVAGETPALAATSTIFMSILIYLSTDFYSEKTITYKEIDCNTHHFIE